MLLSGRRTLRHVPFQAALAAACHNPLLKLAARRLEEKGQSHKPVIAAIAKRRVAVANAVPRSGAPWQHRPAAQRRLLLLQALPELTVVSCAQRHRRHGNRFAAAQEPQDRSLARRVGGPLRLPGHVGVA